MSSASVPISVVVCTRDRPESLRRCLVALCGQDYPSYEVIVVDSASQDGATAQVVAATPFRYLRVELPGLDRARNDGAAAASHDIIAYTDDDVVAGPGWLRHITAAFADPDVMAVTGLVLPAALETEAERLFEQYSGMGKGAAPRAFRRSSLAPRELLAAHHVGVGANMAFRRSTLAAVGGFDTALDVGTPAGGAGDLDMFHRVLAAGLTIRYEPAAAVRHYHRRDRAGLRRQIYNNGRSFGVYLIKRWREQQIARPDVALFAARWVGGWLIARLCARLAGRLRFPLDLVLAEIWGALSAPWAYRATYRHDRALRSAGVGRPYSGVTQKVSA